MRGIQPVLKEIPYTLRYYRGEIPCGNGGVKMNDVKIGDEIQVVVLKDGEDKTAVNGWYLGKEIVDIEDDDSDEIIDKIETPKLVLRS